MAGFKDFLRKIFHRKPKAVPVGEATVALPVKPTQDSLSGENDALKKLRKELSDLQDELDDINDELADTKKGYDKIKKENIDLKNNLKELNNNYTAIKHQTEDLKDRNEDIEKNLSRKISVLKIADDILNAKEANSKDAVEISEMAAKIVNFVQDNLCDVLRNTTDISMGILDQYQSDIWTWGNLQKKTWLQGKTVVAFVGEFSAGKTTIVNRILTQDKNDVNLKLPVKGTPTTAIATYISYGPDTYVQFTDPAGNLKNIHKDTFTYFSKDSIDDFNLAKLVQNFVIKYNNEHLQKLSILDTPGFSSNDHEDERRTAEVIREADALFWVLDVNAGDINSSSVKIIKEHLEGLPLFIIINKVDGKSPGERQKVLEKVKKTLEEKEVPVQDYIVFSEKEPLKNIMDIISVIEPRRDDDGPITERLKDIIEDEIKKNKEIMDRFLDIVKEKQESATETEGKIRKIDLNFKTLRKDFNENAGNMKDNIKDGWFGSQKIKDQGAFWKAFNNQEKTFGEILELLPNYAAANTNKTNFENQKKDAEENKKNQERKFRALKQVLTDFKKLLDNFETVQL
ncbi:hypothetical protein FACS189445_4130 [Spirochaetia bacterium]|nr:hypothetical protein FACS189445_4130 [Spirochaetia bacterium]